MGVYNAEHTLRAAVDSVLQQSLLDFEFVIVNDGSTDGTGAILTHYQQRDSRIRVINQPNQGLTKSLVLGCELATGKLIARQDADDVSLPERLQKQVEILSRNDQAVLATSWVEDVSPEGVRCGVHRELPHSITLRSGQLHSLVGIPAHGSVLIRRDSLERAGGYRACFYYAQDSDLWLRLSEQGRFVVVPEVLYRRVIGTQSISSRFRGAQSRFCELAQECFRAVQDGRSESEFLAEAESLADGCRKGKGQPTSRHEQATSLLLLAGQLRAHDPVLSKKYLRLAVKTCPIHWRSWKALLLNSLRPFKAGGQHSNPELHHGEP